ncbi:hypothetical protein FSHL1_010593 [Fusarium sambucinum]
MAAQHALYDRPSTILVDNKIRVVPYAVLQNVTFVFLIARPSRMKAFCDLEMVIHNGQRQDICEHCYATFDVGMSDLGFVRTWKEGMSDNTNRSIG